MFKRFRVDKFGNKCYEYELDEQPFKWVEARRISNQYLHCQYDLFCKNVPLAEGHLTRSEILKRMADETKSLLPSHQVEQLQQGKLPFGYEMHHLVPRSLGGVVDDPDNIVLVPTPVHKALHEYLQEGEIYSFLLNVDPAKEVPNGQKVFVTVPLLPKIVRWTDVPYINNHKVDSEVAERRELIVHAFLEKYPHFKKQKPYSRPYYRE